MSEEQTVATETVSEETTTEATTQTDVGALIAESKKYRKRSQEAESRLAKLEAQLAKQEEAKLIQEGKKDEVIAKYRADNESLTAKAEKYDSLIAQETDMILAKFPEEEREELASLGISSLRILNKKIENTKPNAPEVIGTSKGFTTNKSWGEMTDAERRAFYEEKARG